MTASGSDAFPLGRVVAIRLRRLLDAKGMSEEELARRAGCPLSVVEDLLRGNSGAVNLTVLQDIAVALGSDAEDLTERDPEDAA